MDIDRIWHNDGQLKALTGLSRRELAEIMTDFESGLAARSADTGCPGGRPLKLNSKGIVLMLMMYYRHYLTLEAFGALFDIDNGNVKRWIDVSEEVLHKIFEKNTKAGQLAHRLNHFYFF